MSQTTLSRREKSPGLPLRETSGSLNRPLCFPSATGQEGSFSVLELGQVTRVALMIVPRRHGAFHEQVEEVLAVQRSVLGQHKPPAIVTIQTVFLREPHRRTECEQLFARHYGPGNPVTNFVSQPPCCGAALAVEAWAIAGKGVELEHFGPQALAVSYGGLRWIHCAGVVAASRARGVYDQATDGFRQLKHLLGNAGTRFARVVRTWLYLGGINGNEAGRPKYDELNRARKNIYRGIQFRTALSARNGQAAYYPASTGIGTADRRLVMSCLALETRRQDVFAVSLENPQQTPAYDYPSSFALHSPRFARAMVLVTGNYVTTWISGTASIVNAQSTHPGDVEAQTSQTIDNIEALIASENFRHHDIEAAGARLSDLAKIRVYLKRAQDLERCRRICEKRFGRVPALYLQADICRPELLVEIEGVAFSNRGFL